MAYNIGSLNCKGLRDSTKRKQTFTWLFEKKMDIIYLQETHSVPDDENRWSKEWGGPMYYSHGTNDSKGVAIMFKKHVNFNVIDTIRKGGRLLVLNVTLNGKNIVLSNVYAPNTDDVNFFQEATTNILELDSPYMILGGDFNLVLNLEMDKTGGLKKTHTKACIYLKQFMKNQNIVDIWRIQHPDTRQYTWRVRRPYSIHCRLDMFLVSDSLQTCISKSDISPSINTDHSLISISPNLTDIKRGPGYWKLNCSLLTNKDYILMIKNVIEQSKNQFQNENLNPNLKWEMIKMEIRRNTIVFSSQKKKSETMEQIRLEQEILVLENKIEKNEDEYDTLNQNKVSVKNIIDNKIKGNLIRSRLLDYEHGDRPSKYFLNLEIENQSRKSIFKLKSNNGMMIENKAEILLEIHKFYSKLYCNQNSYEEAPDHIKCSFFPDQSHVQLTSDMIDSCEGIITKQELSEALKATKNNKSPGIDGIPYEFYKMFWNDIHECLLDSLNFSYEQGELSINQRRGVISLLPKGNKDALLLTNWRPITLLCTDFKLASKVIATRLKQTLPLLINTCQTGFIAGRYIGENINTIMQIIELTEDENIPGLLLSADFSKAFDNLDWSYLERVLNYFKFGNSFQRWINLFNTNISATVNVNGWFTKYFIIEKGARQGDPIAAYLFILGAEMLGHKIRTEINIKGIKLGQNTYKISQFADDTVLFLDGSQDSLVSALQTLTDFSQLSGLAVNYAKTDIYKIGQLRNLQGTYDTVPAIQWSDGPVSTLGVKIPIINRNKIFELNYEPKIKGMELTFRRWTTRCLSLKGKVTIVKSLGLSKVLYLASVLPYPPDNIIKRINQLIFSFIWNNKNDKIKRSVMINCFEEGGMKTPHFETFCKALKVTWVKRYISTEQKDSQWITLTDYSLQTIAGKFGFRCLINKPDVDDLRIKSTFWKDVLKSWCEYNFVIQPSNDTIPHQIIWLNSNIKINNKLILYPACINNNLLTIDNLFHDKQLLDRDILNIIYDVNITVMEFNSIISAIPREWKRYMTRNISASSEHNIKYNTLENMSLKLVSQTVYKDLLTKVAKPVDLQEKWMLYIPNELESTDILFTHLYKVTIDNVLRSFQYKLLHRIIFFNAKLHLFGITENPSCDACNDNNDSIEHKLWLCPQSQQLWDNLLKWYNNKFKVKITLNYTTVISNLTHCTLLFDLFVLLTKHYIFKSFLNKENTNIHQLLKEITNIEKIEKAIAFRKGKTEQHLDKWGVLAS